jgi:hypothetical protein
LISFLFRDLELIFGIIRVFVVELGKRRVVKFPIFLVYLAIRRSARLGFFIGS